MNEENAAGEGDTGPRRKPEYDKAAYQKAYLEARVAAGLCRACARPREGDGATARLCPACAERERERSRSRKLTPEQRQRYNAQRNDAYRRRKEAKVCAYCGGAIDVRAEAAGWAACSACRKRYRKAGRVHEKREREKTEWGKARGGRPLPVGRGAQSRLGEGARRVTVDLDPECQRALVEMGLRDQRRQSARARAGGAPIEDYALGPLLVRAAILQWKDECCPPRRRRPDWTKPLLDRPQPVPDPYDPEGQAMIPACRQRFLGPSVKIGLWLDAECLRIVERDAAELYRGNRSEAIRAMLAAQQREAPELMRHLRVIAPPTYTQRLAGMSRRNPRFCDTEPEDDPYFLDGERAALWGRG